MGVVRPYFGAMVRPYYSAVVGTFFWRVLYTRMNETEKLLVCIWIVYVEILYAHMQTVDTRPLFHIRNGPEYEPIVYKCKINEWGCRDGMYMYYAKNHGNKEIPLAILSRILEQSCVTLCLNLNYVGRGYA